MPVWRPPQSRNHVLRPGAQTRDPQVEMCTQQTDCFPGPSSQAGIPPVCAAQGPLGPCKLGRANAATAEKLTMDHMTKKLGKPQTTTLRERVISQVKGWCQSHTIKTPSCSSSNKFLVYLRKNKTKQNPENSIPRHRPGVSEHLPHSEQR